ncbi:MAG: type-F conjugative transfer system protein TraW [Mariprofundales bacterium]
MNLAKFQSGVRVLVFFLLFSSVSFAETAHIPVIGKIYPIQEQNLMEYIQARLQQMQETGEMAILQKQWKAKAEASIKRPASRNIPTATQKRVRWFDPSIKIPSTITDHQGNVLAFAGEVINPLKQVNLSRPLIFFDGDNEQQIAWASQQNAKLIITKGNPWALMQKLKTRVYFDQKGTLTKRFGIQYLPSFVDQDSKNPLMLRITEEVMQ